MRKTRFFYIAVFVTLTAFIFAFTFINNNGNGQQSATFTLSDNGEDTSIVGIANIIENKDGSVDFNFNEHQTIFTLAKDNKNLEFFLRTAKVAKEKNYPVKIIFNNPNMLTNLANPSDKELAIYLEKRRYDLKDTDPNISINTDKIDTSTFNFVEYQKWKVFKLCTNLIPTYTEAKKIFDFCAAQQCTYGPTQITPCIPFQYVPDGCFARAHKMRYIIETKYKYCSEKVFSYSYWLDVKATKWGGCCIHWWYHVAPLVRVNNPKGRPICYVIDPSMFGKPVTLSTWLGAQQNPTCATGENITTYSIQPSSAYQPSYSTDPNYNQTNIDLVNYNNQGASCPQ
jgi:Glutaminase